MCNLICFTGYQPSSFTSQAGASVSRMMLPLQIDTDATQGKKIQVAQENADIHAFMKVRWAEELKSTFYAHTLILNITTKLLKDCVKLYYIKSQERGALKL